MELDSSKSTLLHKKRINELLLFAAKEIMNRAVKHDDSKLESPEKEYFDEFTPKLANSSFGSEEYNDFLKGLKVALDHHYENNSHHPQHYDNGVDGFDLFDLIEMFFDWKASSERHHDGDIYKSIDINKDRFNISEQIINIFKNTANRLNY